MSKSKKLLAENTVIVWNDISVGEYRNFFEQTIGKDFGRSVGNMDFQTQLFTQAGKTLKEAVEEHFHPSGQKNMEEMLVEQFLNIIIQKTNI